MQEINGREILETIEEVHEEIRNKRVFEKKIFSEIIAHLMGNEKYTDIDYIIDTDHSLLLSVKNKLKEQVAIKIYLTHQSEYSTIYTLINQIKVQNYDQFQNYVQIYNIKTAPLSNDVLMLYIEQEICGQSLLDIILSYKPKNIEIEQELKLQIVIKILDALNYLHKQNMSHKNLKFSNILQSSKSYKLTDQFLEIHGILKYDSVVDQEEDQESKDIELKRFINNYQMKAPEGQDVVESALQSDLFTLGIMLLQLDNIQKFNYTSIEQLQNDYEKFFSQGQVPPQLQLQSDTIFYRNALTMIRKNPSDRMTCEYYIQNFIQYLKEKKINMAINVESLEVDYQRKIQTNSRVLLQTIQSDKKIEMVHESLEELKSQFEGDFDGFDNQDQSHNFQEDMDEEEKDKFDDGTGIILTIENNLIQPPNFQIQDQKNQKKKSSFYNIQVIGDEMESDDNEKILQNNRSPPIQSLNNSKLYQKNKPDQIGKSSINKQDGKSKFSTLLQINQSALQDENDVDDQYSNYSGHKQLDAKQINQQFSTIKKQEDTLSQHSQQLESPQLIKSKKELPSQQKLSSQQNIQSRERQNSDEIQRQFDENQKKLSQRKLQLQVQKSNLSQEVSSPIYLNQSPQLSQQREQRNDLILLSRIVQDKKLQQQSQIIQSGVQSGINQSGFNSAQRDDTLSQKQSQIVSSPERKPQSEPIQADEIQMEEKIQIMEEQKEEQYQVQVKWNNPLDQSQKLISNPLQSLIDEIGNKSKVLQSLQLDFTQYKILNGPTILSLQNEMQYSANSLKQLHLNICNNPQLRFSYINIFLEKLAEQQSRCFIFFKSIYHLVDLNLKIDTPGINGFLIRDLISRFTGTLVKLNFSLQNTQITNYCSDKIMAEVKNCKHLKNLVFSIPTDQEYEKFRAVKLKKIHHVCLISNQISYFRFTNDQNTQSIVNRLEDFNQFSHSQDILKIRIMENNFKLSSESFSKMIDFIETIIKLVQQSELVTIKFIINNLGKFKFMKKLTVCLHKRNIMTYQSIEQLMHTLSELKFLTDLNLKFEQYLVGDYKEMKLFLKLKDAKIFMKNIIIFNYTGSSLDYVKRHLKALNKNSQLQLLGLKIPGVLSVDSYIIKFISTYFYQKSIEIINVETSQFDLSRQQNTINITVTGTQVLIDKMLVAIISQGQQMQQLHLTYNSTSKATSLNKVLPQFAKLINLKEVEIIQDGWVNMKWLINLLNQIKLLRMQKIFISNPEIEIRFNNTKLAIFSSTQKSLEPILDFFDDEQDFYQEVRDLQIVADHKLLFNNNIKIRLTNIILTTKVHIDITTDHINLENIDQIFDAGSNTFNSDQISICSDNVTSLIATSQQIRIKIIFMQYQTLNSKNQQIICNAFSQFESLNHLTLDLRQFLFLKIYSN